jgi:GTP-binding protein HflX
LPPDLLAAFRATLEEISDSDLLIHLVDAVNPRWQQQLESVERILTELKFGQIPRLTVFNKADLIDREAMEAILRQASQSGAREVVAISANQPPSLRPMLEHASAFPALNLVDQSEGQTQSEEEIEYAAQSSR